jgi:nitrogen-specific signal transduction histidine kinase
MTVGARSIPVAGLVGDLEPRPATLAGGPETVLRTALTAALVAAGYFLGSALGLSLRFPATHISAIWPPNAILLAALLVAPRRRWWIYLLAILPAHLLAQGLMGIPFPIVLINFAGNTAEALLGALAILHFLGEPKRFDYLRAVILIMLVGGLLVPSLVSLGVAQLLALADLRTDTWLVWRLRLLTNALAVFTLVPPLVLAVTRARPRETKTGIVLRRGGEAGALLAGLLIIAILVFALPRAGAGESPLLLYLPLPFLLWAAVRFGLTGVCLSMLALGAMAMWNAIHGHGPFFGHDPIENATSLVLFLDFTCAPLLMLAALLAQHESAEEDRRRAETLHGAVLASVRDQIAVLDHDGYIREVNESWSAADRSEVGTSYLELCRREAQGSDENEAQMLAGLEAVLSGARPHFQVELVPPPGPPGVWLEISAEGLKRPEGGAVVTCTDITGRKQAELAARLHQQELAHLTRVAMLGELSGALAHELNQPLTAILSNAQAGQRLLAREPVDLAEVRDILHDIAEDDRRAGEVIKRLRAMLKKDEVKSLPLDLNELVEEVIDFSHSDLITRNVALTVELAPALPPVLGDRVQLQQVLLNLVLNACEAMKAKPTWERRLTMATAPDADDGVRVSVVDRGTGIPADELERVFEPFFTTKEHGLGLGLSICRSIVAAHGGRLWAGNNENGGATFHLTLPLDVAPP